MAGSDFAQYRIRYAFDHASTMTWEAICNGHLSSAEQAMKLIVLFDLFTTVHGGGSEAFKLQWENLTDDPGVFNDVVTGSGDIRPHASAGVITNGDPIGNSGSCNSGTIDDGEEVENESPLQTATLTAAQNNDIEIQFAIDLANAIDGKTYRLYCYSTTASARMGGYFNIVMAAGSSFEAEKTFTLDTALQKLDKEADTFTLDTALQNIDLEADTFTIDAVLQKVDLAADTFTLDTRIVKRIYPTFTIDAAIRKTVEPSFTIDTMLLAGSPETTFTIDTALQKVDLAADTFTLDVAIGYPDLDADTFTIDSVLSWLDLETQFTLDSALQKIDLTADTFTLDTQIVNAIYTTFTIDSALQLIDKQITFTLDVQIGVSTVVIAKINGIPLP